MWRVFGSTVRGASHRRRQLPNQDALGWSKTPSGDWAIAVADGHGSSSCFRSGAGAALAVTTSLDLMAEFASHDFSQQYLDDVEHHLKGQLVARWRDAVADHLSRNPFSGDELDLLARKPPRNSYVPYGSTLLAAVASATHLFLLQIGDGDILMVPAEGNPVRPWPRDARLLGVETTSLCTDDAELNVRLRVEPLTPESPRLVLLCTDGYSNSFRDDSGFLKVGTDILEIIDEEGADSVELELEGWLNEASNLGSGDDVTLGVMVRQQEKITVS